MQRSAIAVRKQFFRVAGAGFLVCMITASPSHAQTADTQFDALVCSGDSSNASMVVTTPQTDRVVNHSPITIQGSVYNISQVDVFVDEAYAGTVAVPQHATTFTATQGLAEGTHTLRLVGVDVCQFQDVTVELVVTYHPDAAPPTLVDEGVVVNGPQTITPAEAGPLDGERVTGSPRRFEDIPLIGEIVPFLRTVARGIDLDATARDGGAGLALFRAVSFTTGLGLLLYGSEVVRFLYRRAFHFRGTRAISQQLVLQDPKLNTHFRYWKVGAHVTGLVLLIAVFVV